MNGIWLDVSELPRMVKVAQDFPRPVEYQFQYKICQQLDGLGHQGMLRAGERIAVAVGSRGIVQIDLVVKTVVDWLKLRGCVPIIVPAMGSHGGATAEGQAAYLGGYGISEETMGVPVVSSMDVVELGSLEDGFPIYFDRSAAGCDGVIVINRVKPHTDFRGKIESGLSKMLVIGLGKHKGAQSAHRFGINRFGEVIPKAAKVIISRLPQVVGVAILENAYAEIAHVEVVASCELQACEERLLEQAWGLMPRILYEQFDILVIDEVGKEISGDVMDPNVTGRYYEPSVQGSTRIGKIVVLGLTDRSDGNIEGIGTADVITKGLLMRADMEKAYINSITSGVLASSKIPLVAKTDRDAIAIAAQSCWGKLPGELEMVHIKNTLELTEIEASLPLIQGSNKAKDVRVIGEPYSWTFDEAGRLRDRFKSKHN